MPWKSMLSRLWSCRRAATAIEYGLIVALIVIAMIGALQFFANTNTGIWNNVSSKVQAAS
ncbi:MAG: Flp family type IVb pilin [Sphingomonas sp.]|nr:Flp family type IVb pilin [Sphingomonas sp.]